MCFRVNPIWLPNHVTYDVTCVNLLFLMDRRSYVWFHLDLFSHFKEDFCRFLKTTTIWLPNGVTEDVINIFGGPFYPEMTLKIFHTDQM